jgi:phytoene dehydrogenase-like protein
MRPLVLEALTYPGGCASTYKRGGTLYESGATLFSGFGEGMLFQQWTEDYSLPVVLEQHDPLVSLRLPDREIRAGQNRQAWIAQFIDAAPDQAQQIHEFFRYQERVGDALWGVLADDNLLPPFRASSLAQHVRKLPAYVPLLSCMGRTLADVMKRHGVYQIEALRTTMSALSQITVQADVDSAEAPFALATSDYFFRGTGHIRGGIGSLAWALADTIEEHGGTISFASRAKAIEFHGEHWSVETRRAVVCTKNLVANLTPQQLQSLAPGVRFSERARQAGNELERGWSAAMLYLRIRDDSEIHPWAHHIEAINDPSSPLNEGNHIFTSISGANEKQRAPETERTVTVSTHVPLARMRAQRQAATLAEYISHVQARMRETLHNRAPEIAGNIVHEMTGSPRTFERFTGRPHGMVGGAPRTAGLHHYFQLGPVEAAPRLHLVGDSVFPGQSTLATALGGTRVAEVIARR